MKWEVHLVMYDDCLKEKHLDDWVAHKLANFFFFSQNTVFTRKNDWQAIVIQTWVLGKQFSENEQCETVTSRKTIANICFSNKFGAFKQKLEFGKLVSLLQA